MSKKTKSPSPWSSTSPDDDGRPVWTFPNSKQLHVLEPKEPIAGGAPPNSAIELMKELGMPEGAVWARLQLSGNMFGSEWRSYELELFGMVVPSNDKEEYPWPVWIIKNDQALVLPIVIQLWRQRVRFGNSPVFGEVLWNPTLLRRVSLKGLEHSHSNGDVDFARRGLELLEAVTHSGRPFGSTVLSTEEFLLRAPIECRKWSERFDGKCSDANLAEALGIGTSTLYGYLKRTGLKMKDIREQAKNLDLHN